jgi:CubicO group peptidase (beta-lactamase class C family)
MSSAGLSGVRLDRMHDIMAGHVERGVVPGIVTLVSRRGEVHVDAIGTKAFGGSDPMGRDTIFRIASVTKPIVASAAMILVEECILRLDEPVDPWLCRNWRTAGSCAPSTARSTTPCPRIGRSPCATC